jgi:antitoxin (DNA-binding transcriptional repressor) of toxin-antitoxin stability system
MCIGDAEPVTLLDEGASGSYLAIMRAVGLKILKNRLSEYVRLAASGETVLVTDRERVVAELTPPREGRATLAGDAILADAVRKGWLTPAAGSADGSIPRRPAAPLASVLADLEDDRADR